MSKFKKGDILCNGWTTGKNPYHLTMFIKSGVVDNQKTFDCLGYDGEILKKRAEESP